MKQAMCYVRSVPQGRHRLENGSQFKTTLEEWQYVMTEDPSLWTVTRQDFVRRRTDQIHTEENWHFTPWQPTCPGDCSAVVACTVSTSVPASEGGCVRMSICFHYNDFDFFRQMTMKKSPDNSKKKNVWGNSGVATARVMTGLPQI